MTNEQIQSAILEIPDRLYNAIKFEIEAEIYTLENGLTAQIACQHGAVSYIAGSIASLRTLLDTLENCRKQI